MNLSYFSKSLAQCVNSTSHALKEPLTEQTGNNVNRSGISRLYYGK